MTRISGPLAGLVLALLLATLLTACGRDDGRRILGHWRAERVQVQSVSLPMGPEFVVTPRELTSAEGDIRIPISSIEADGNAVTLGAPFGIGLSFYFESADRIYFDVPLAGRVYFQRVADAPQPARANPAPAPQALAALAPLPPPAPAAAPALSTTPAAPLQPAVPAPVAPPLAAAPSLPTPAAAANAPAPAPRGSSAPAQGPGTVDLIRQAEQKLAANALAEAEALLTEARRQYGGDPMIDYHLAVLTLRRGDPDGAVRKLRDAFQNGFRDFALLDASTDLAPLRSDPRYNALVTRYR